MTHDCRQDDDLFWAEFPGRLEGVRRDRGYGLRELARLAGINPNTLERWERGQRRPAYPLLVRLCRVLAITPDALFSLPEIWRVPPHNHEA